MGRRGPPRTPIELKLMRGTTTKAPIGSIQPTKTHGAEPPADLSASAAAVWREIAPRLEALGLLTEIDLPAFAQYCDLRARYQQARDYLSEHGAVYEVFHRQTAAQLKAGEPLRLKYVGQRPEVSIYNQLGRQLMQIAAQFGMTPSSRTGLGVKPASDSAKIELRRRLYGKR